MPVTPSTPAQFQAAQERLRDAFGQIATFHIPKPKSYGSTPMDPELGVALDPLQEPPDDFDDVAKKVGVVHRPLGRTGGIEDQTRTTAAGIFAAESVVLIVNLSDQPDLEDATEVTVINDRYKIRDWQADGIGAVQRWLCFVEDMA
jgi:hypothetical protein